MKYLVRLFDIEWDDGKGEYDVSEAPNALLYEVEAPDRAAALEYAMQEADEEVGCLISGAKSTVVSVKFFAVKSD